MKNKKISKRLKNPWFWVGLVGAVLTAMGVKAETFTSWDIVGKQLVALVSNPFMIGSVVLTVLGIFVDPTTKGLKDKKE